MPRLNSPVSLGAIACDTELDGPPGLAVVAVDVGFGPALNPTPLSLPVVELGALVIVIIPELPVPVVLPLPVTMPVALPLLITLLISTAAVATPP